MLKLGCCGWGYFRVNDFLEKYRDEGKDWKEIYDHKVQAFADFFNLVEVNSTFYDLPQVKTAEKWRRLADEVNEDFEFTVKCQKTVTHGDRFKSEDSVAKFDETKKIAEALGAKIILLQSPPSFGPSEENIKNVKGFFEKIDREDFILAWEPRGDWEEDHEKIKEVCNRFDLIHCSDPFKFLPFSETGTSYLRLHGKPPGDEMYKYTYKKKDLEKLKGLLDQIKSQEKYVLWNNYNMYEDLKKFEKLL